MAKSLKKLNEELLEAKGLLERAETEKDKKEYQELVDSITEEIKKCEKTTPDKAKQAEKYLSIMERYKVNELYINSKGAVFTSKNLAELTEKDKSKIKIVTREIAESLIK